MKLTHKLFFVLAISISACTPETRNDVTNRSQFDVVRGGVNLDELALTCTNDPQSVGFEASQECFAYAQTLP